MFAAILGLIVGLPPEAGAHHDEVVDKLEHGVTERVSISSKGEQGDSDSGCVGNWFSASDNGRFVAFASAAGNLHPGDVNGQVMTDIFVYDRKKRKLDLVSALPTGLAPEPPASVDLDLGCSTITRSEDPVISGNGRYIAFVSNLPLTGTDDPDAAAPLPKIFVRDLKRDTTELVSRTWDGKPAPGSEPSISDDGRFVAFQSNFPTMVKEDPCPPFPVVPGITVPLACPQVYVRDREKNETVLVSRSTAGEPSNALNGQPQDSYISGNGRYVVFESEASNLVPDDRNLVCPLSPSYGGPSCSDVFVHDLRTEKTELVSISRDGTSANNGSWVRYGAGSQRLSDDGRFIQFYSYATDLVPHNDDPCDPLNPSGAYVRDLKTGRTERVSVTSTGAVIDSGLIHDISDDGRYVMFRGFSSECLTVPQDNSHRMGGGFIYDRKTGQTDFVTLPSAVGEPPGTWFSGAIGGNARFVVGSHYVNDVVENDTNDAWDVFVRDIGTYDLGVGPFSPRSSSRSIAFPARPSFEVTGAATVRDAPHDALVPGRLGSEILETRIAYRPELDDLFVRIDVERIFGSAPLTGLTPYPMIYGAKITTGSGTYELRAQGYGGPIPAGGGTFGLFKCTEATCTEMVKITGGYGTVGETVVASVPLRYLGLDDGGELAQIKAFTALGSYVTGATRILDSVTLE